MQSTTPLFNKDAFQRTITLQGTQDKITPATTLKSKALIIVYRLPSNWANFDPKFQNIKKLPRIKVLLRLVTVSERIKGWLW